MLLSTIVIVVVLLVVGILGYAATRPDSFEVQRRTTIRAAADSIFPLLDDFHQWSAWSPWEKLDPEMTRTFSGEERGKGAIYAWEGNKKVGQGRMEIVGSNAPTRMTVKLDFIKPWESQNLTDFSLDERADGTTLTWTMRGHHTFMMKLMGVFMSLDKMIGKDFEAGLASIKEIAEARAEAGAVERESSAISQ
jgi:hypothetical protein